MDDDLRTPFIAIRDLHRIYTLGSTEVRALDGVDLDIGRGDFVSIMGPSGSGKSTMMNIIGCLDSPDKGSYSLDGAEVAKLSADQRAELRSKSLGFVFQSFNLLSRTTALENVELPLLYNQALRPSDVRRRALEALDMVGLSDRAAHYPSKLSGGQQQRVAIARAIVNKPLLILADEPTGNLDSAMSVEIMNLFSSLNSHGITIVLVTHEEDIAAFGRRTVVFRDGRIVSDRSTVPPGAAA